MLPNDTYASSNFEHLHNVSHLVWEQEGVKCLKIETKFLILTCDHPNDAKAKPQKKKDVKTTSMKSFRVLGSNKV